MNKSEKERVSRFINDPIANEAVYNYILEAVQSEDEKDVHILAAAQLATLSLQKAWKKLEKEVRQLRIEEQKKVGQIGL